MTDLPELPAGAFDKQDGGDDLAFYAPPRLVTHIDEGAVAALTDWYAQVIPRDAVVLDLMSSWVSHLPDDLTPREAIGHGMNAVELAANPRLDRWFVQNLNRDHVLPLTDGTVDVALCCVGVQYLQRPVEVFAEIHRVLAPGAAFVVSFSNRCFPMKAVRIWLSLSIKDQARLVALYMDRAGFASTETRMLADGRDGDPLVAVTGRKASPLSQT